MINIGRRPLSSSPGFWPEFVMSMPRDKKEAYSAIAVWQQPSVTASIDIEHKGYILVIKSYKIDRAEAIFGERNGSLFIW